ESSPAAARARAILATYRRKVRPRRRSIILDCVASFPSRHTAEGTSGMGAVAQGAFPGHTRGLCSDSPGAANSAVLPRPDRAAFSFAGAGGCGAFGAGRMHGNRSFAFEAHSLEKPAVGGDAATQISGSHGQAIKRGAPPRKRVARFSCSTLSIACGDRVVEG